jgi:hypothetical protein
MELKRKPGRHGEVDLYWNDVYGLLKTFEVCSMKQQQYQRRSFFYQGDSLQLSNLKEDRQLIEEYYGVEFSHAHDISHPAICYSYEFLKLKYCFTRSNCHGMETKVCWRSLNNDELTEILKLIINSADKGKTEKALAEIDEEGLTYEAPHVLRTLEELRTIHRLQ